MNLQLFYATNRNHQGKDRWNPTGYGPNFSSDGHYNLRFGKVDVEANETTVQKHLNKTFANAGSGDGEKLADYLGGLLKNSKIKAYKDETAEKEVEFEHNSSTRMFLDVKTKMEQANDVLIFIHGYNVKWESAVASALALELMLNKDKKKGEKHTMVVLFTWPSDGSMMPFAAYKSDRSDARDSAQSVGRGLLKLRDFLSKLRANAEDETWKACNQNIHLLCHSMGNYVLQNALKKVEGYAMGNRMPRMFTNIFLCAADIDDNVFESNGGMNRLHELTNHISIYYNNADLALHISDYTKSNPQRLGHTGTARPQLVHNKIHQVDCSDVVNGIVEHSYYLWAMVNTDISQTISGIPFDEAARRRKRLANSREWKLV